jgi:hypothetical protein
MERTSSGLDCFMRRTDAMARLFITAGLFMLVSIAKAQDNLPPESPIVPTETAPLPQDPTSIPPREPVDPAIEAEGGLPPWLPNYRIQIDMPAPCGMLSVKQNIEWTNPSSRAADEILLHVYPRHRPNKQQLELYERTMESFRINPRISIDREGRRFHLRQLRVNGQDAEYYWDENADTVMHIKLAQPILGGQTVNIDMDYQLDVQEVHYRLGYWKGVTNLTNWYPIVAYHGQEGWIAPPFIGWHQPFLNEAGNYDVTLTHPANLEVVTGGQLVETTERADGKKEQRWTAQGLRDFSLVASQRHEIHSAEVEGVKVTVHAFPEHRFYAKIALEAATESIARYTRLLGPYPHPEFKIVETYFGWNGNETSGMVLIDERVFDAPKLGHIYVDHLVSHETLHQWWYATVGTDGFHETWMDEAIVSHLTEHRIHEKYGDQINLLDLPHALRWLPNIDYDSFMHNGYYLYRARGGKGQVLAPLPKIGHVHNLFFLAYDRGGRVVSMLHHRLGEERFYDFLRTVYAKYQFRILFVADFEKELELYTGQSWTKFFDDWLRSPKYTDWTIDRVDVDPVDGGYQTTIDVKQLGPIEEPVTIGIKNADGASWQEVRLEPTSNDYDAGSAKVRRKNANTWQVTLHSAERPRQVEVDPKRQILDENLFNNRWKPAPKIRFSPIYTPLEEIALARPLDRPSFFFGPSVDAEGRVGVRGSLMEPNRYRISPFIVYPLTRNDSVLAAGVDGEIYHTPYPNFSIGGRYERTLATDLFDLPGDQGEVYLRYNYLYTSSFLYPNLGYVDTYFRFGDNFFPDENYRRPDNPLAETYRNIRAVGLRFHLDTRMPYWNPERGFAIDAAYENGFHAFNAGESFNRGFGQVAAVRKLPDGLGYFSETRIASRVRGGIGSPNNGEHFHFGGPLSFRGQRSEDTEGSAFWLTGADWRFPIWGQVDREFFDQTVRANSIYGAMLYDVGESFILGQSQGVDHAIGMGLYLDLGLFSFVDRLTVRAEYAYSLRYDSDIVWFGIYHAY